MADEDILFLYLRSAGVPIDGTMFDLNWTRTRAMLVNLASGHNHDGVNSRLLGYSAPIDIGGITAFHVDSSGNFWIGAELLANAPFSVSAAGAVNATSIALDGAVMAGGTITGAIVRTAESGARVLMDSSGISGWNISGAQTIDINVDGSGWIGLGGVKGIEWSAGGAVRVAGFLVNATQVYTVVAGKMTLMSSGAVAFSAGTVGSPEFSVSNTGVLVATSATITGALAGGTIDIGGADATSFHVDVAGNMWMGAALFANGVFKVTSGGSLTATGATISGTITASAGTIGGWTAHATDGLYTGTGITRIQFKISEGIWLGATTFAAAKFSVTPAGTMKAQAGTIGAFSIDATHGLYAGTGATRVQMDPGVGIWCGHNDFVSAPFKVSPAGDLVATSATITGAITATSGSFTGTVNATDGVFAGTVNATDGTFSGLISGGQFVGGSFATAEDVDIMNPGVIIDALGIRGYANVGGVGIVETFNLPINGDPPSFYKGIIKETVIEIYTSGVIKTSEDALAGAGGEAGVLINPNGIFAGSAGQDTTNANFRVSNTGVLVALSATISGAISAATIDIGGADTTSFHVDTDGNIWSGAALFANGVFKVSNAGALTATSAVIIGDIKTSIAAGIGPGKTEGLHLSAVDNQMYFYGAELAGGDPVSLICIGAFTWAGADEVLIRVGTAESERYGIVAHSLTKYAIYGINYGSSIGVAGKADNGIGVYASSTDGEALRVNGLANLLGLTTTTGGIHVGGTSDPGADNLIVDGTLRVGAAITSTKAGGTILTSTSSGTNAPNIVFTNTGGDLYFGIEGSVGGSILAGSAAYSLVLGTGGATAMQFFTANTLRMTITATGGLRVPGVLTVGAINYAADAQANDTYVITLSPSLAAYFTGMIIVFYAKTANTGAATLNVNSLGAKTIVKAVSTALANNDILAGMLCLVVYDGANFVLMNPRTL